MQVKTKDMDELSNNTSPGIVSIPSLTISYPSIANMVVLVDINNFNIHVNC